MVVEVDTGSSWIDMQRGACHIDCTPLGNQTSLLYGILSQGEAYLIPTWLMQEQRLAQVKINQSINQSINQPTKQASKQASKQATQVCCACAHIETHINRVILTV